MLIDGDNYITINYDDSNEENEDNNTYSSIETSLTPVWMKIIFVIFKIGRILMNITYIVITSIFFTILNKISYNILYMDICIAATFCLIIGTSITNVILLAYEIFIEYNCNIMQLMSGNVKNIITKFICGVKLIGFSLMLFNLILLVTCIKVILDSDKIYLSTINHNIFYYMVIYFIIEYSIFILFIIIFILIASSLHCVIFPSLLVRSFQYLPIRLGAQDIELENMKDYSIKDNDLNYILTNNTTGETFITDKENPVCIICRDIYIDTHIIRYLECKHYYHKECCDAWLKINKSCPMCRSKVIL